MNLQDLLLQVRVQRNFKTEEYLDKKIHALNEFFRSNHLNAAVIGLSGGIDSAVVFALLVRASNQRDSPIKKNLGLAMPIHAAGATRQADATKRALLLEGLSNTITSIKIVDLTEAHNSYIKNAGYTTTDWAKGQLASIVRTPCLYYHAAILQAEGLKSIVAGTTNRDEGSYIGFFGKASDAMVDLQPIGDIHKSEVYQLASLLSIPEEIIQATPSGDVWDGKVDEEMIGAPYWFLELYLLMKSFDLMDSYNLLNEKDKRQFDVYASHIEEIHQKNSHKYKVGNPAHFIDVLERNIPGGW